MSDDIDFEILSLKNISHIYDQENHKLKVLSNINIVIKKGEMVSLIGPSGSGKSTLFKLISHILDDYDGSIDVDGVGQLVKIACENGKRNNSKIKLGICGEHGGDPDSIDFCHNAGLNYVSCSPYRVPIARLAAAQAKIRSKR